MDMINLTIHHDHHQVVKPQKEKKGIDT